MLDELVIDTSCEAEPRSGGDLPIAAMTVSQLFTAAEAFDAVGDRDRTAALYGAWLLGNERHDLRHVVYFNYAVALNTLGQSAHAGGALQRCLEIAPDFSPARINLGRILEDGGRADIAVGQWLTVVDQLKTVNGNSVKYKLLALHQAARVLEAHNKDSAAEEALQQALEIHAHQPEAIQHLIALRQRQCKWPVIAACGEATPTALLAGISPLSLANLLDEPMFQLARASKYNKDSIQPASPARSEAHPRQARTSGKLRIGYVSSDLREHAVGFAMTDVFELHDKSKFEVYAYYCGIARTDATQQRIMAAADSWLDLRGMTDEDVAARITADDIDILVDLNGYTKDARTRVFAFRPALVIVNWFGFPGTMASPYHHYIIADDVIVPPGHERYFSEKVVRLPCYQPNDRKRTVAPVPTRAGEGLPDDAIVYCCLNGSQKYTPQMFAAWMQILKRVDGSVLWLLSATDETDARLRAVAASYGVATERLVFAGKKPNPEHLARYALADLFVDTFPYGAHTTASDSLWMGVPVLTIAGRGFAARVCASLSRAAGLDEMVVADVASYIDKAVRLGLDRQRLAALKSRLAANRDTCTLFDTPRLVKGLEGLYTDMWSDYQAGRLPSPDLANLDVYHDIAVDLAANGPIAAPGQGNDDVYAQPLALRDRQRPMPGDRRLWSKGAEAGA